MNTAQRHWKGVINYVENTIDELEAQGKSVPRKLTDRLKFAQACYKAHS